MRRQKLDPALKAKLKAAREARKTERSKSVFGIVESDRRRPNSLDDPQHTKPLDALD